MAENRNGKISLTVTNFPAKTSLIILYRDVSNSQSNAKYLLIKINNFNGNTKSNKQGSFFYPFSDHFQIQKLLFFFLFYRVLNNGSKWEANHKYFTN